jgi:hypothetical protein
MLCMVRYSLERGRRFISLATTKKIAKVVHIIMNETIDPARPTPLTEKLDSATIFLSIHTNKK